MYRSLRSDEIVKTAESLARRVNSRFPESGLAKVASELRDVACETRDRCVQISRPNVALRVVVVLLLLVGVAFMGAVVANIRFTDDIWHLTTFVESAEALVADLVFVGVGVLFLVTLETRLKRLRALDAINELRALAHIVDMHQLTKDPEAVLGQYPIDSESPERNMNAFELNRYLDYCSEMLAIVAKVGALYVQSFPDRDALRAVDEIEGLTTGLSRKIWQKIMILDRYAVRDAPAKVAKRRPAKPRKRQVAKRAS
jgi:hypothetical protein